jgi:hypothetical protein
MIMATIVLLAPATAARGEVAGHAPLTHHERETADQAGRNDTAAKAEEINGFGTGRHENSQARILGVLSAPPNATDIDFYSVRLQVGDIVGAAVTGSVDGLSLHSQSGDLVVGSRGNLSILYPAASPLPRGVSGRPVLHHVVTRSGRYRLSVSNGTGPYEVTVRVFRPSPEQQPRGTVQTLYVDLDGARVDTTNFEKYSAIPGVRDLSPLSAFLPRWGLSPADEPALEQVIVTTVRDILVADVKARGLNPRAEVRVISSIDHPNMYGAPNVSRVVVGGTIAEAVFALPTVGVAESVDPGNFDREETALILLDLLSGPADDPIFGTSSLNHYMTAASDRVRFIGRVLGATVAHEAGHFYGNFHTDGHNNVTSLMDGSQPDPAKLFGTGPDGIGGTADDDSHPRLERDAYDPVEAFTGIEDTLNVVAFGVSRGRR